LKYAEDYGWEIFPLRPRTKEPFAGIGVYQATSDLAQIRQWWTRWPQANVALHCGGSGILAIDLDLYKDTFNGGGVLTPDDEQTVTNLTGNGGTHLLYKLEDGERYGNAKGNLPSGIDIRGWGGYIVLPPSIHPNGNTYQWEDGYQPYAIPLLPLPGKLRELLSSARTGYRIPGPSNSIAVQIATRMVESVLDRLDIPTSEMREYDGDGRKWILKRCPFQPDDAPHDSDRGAFIVIARDGKVAAGCHHERCRERLRDEKKSGWRWLLAQEPVGVKHAA
jgi:hypothetical protein